MGIFQLAQTKVDPPDAITPEERRIWEKPPDPRIKWALDILEPEPPIKESIWARTMWPSVGVAHGLGFVMWNRYRKSLPLYTGLLDTLLYLDNFFVFWMISKISNSTTISSDCSNKFLTMLTLLSTSRDPLAV